jgi:hypothetical protein
VAAFSETHPAPLAAGTRQLLSALAEALNAEPQAARYQPALAAGRGLTLDQAAALALEPPA